MKFAFSPALLLGGLMLSASFSALAQTEAPVTPVPETSPPASAPVTPAPAAPAPGTPAPARPAPMASGPILITVRTDIPALIGGQKTTTPFVRTLNIPVERAAQIRQAGKITASLDADLNRFMDMLEKVGQDARFMQLEDGGQWVVVQRNNLKIDREATRANVLKVLQDKFEVQANVVVTGQTPPKRTLDFFAQKGITHFLATGQTGYDGSSPERIKNIHVGATNFKDRLFEGKTFSFNQMIGPISTRNGYVPGLVIAGDQTASGVGGGICQVSTTVFRTLYGAGLGILQRQNHSYQVFYYDPQGLDATIYQPQVDLKFSNDTGGVIWFQTEWDDQEATLSITAFGKARDYQVQVDQPKTLKTVPAPKDRIIYDPTLPAGQRKQVDWAAPGATIEVTRRFVRGGKTFKQDTLRSVYRPWPNIFRVGTKK